MTAAASDADQNLVDLRSEIDGIDTRMHELLIARGEIIDRLIAIKRAQGGGSAFRPAREAAMMRRLAESHRGLLPLDTVESVWRIIISTFTYEQSPYSVHVDLSGGDAIMRDSARFHFGFTVPYVAQSNADAVISAVASAAGDLGLIRIEGSAAKPWWARLSPSEAPKVIARLPFVERPDHPAGTPVFVIARPLAEAAAREVILFEIVLERWRDPVRLALGRVGAEIVNTASTEFGLSILVSTPGRSAAEISAALSAVAQDDFRIAEVGSHARRCDVPGGRLHLKANA